MAKRIIKSNRQVLAARRAVLKKNRSAFHVDGLPEGVEEYGGYTIVRLFISDGKAKVCFTGLPANRESPYVEPTIKSEMLKGVTLDRFTRAFLAVRVDTSKSAKDLVLLNGRIYARGESFYVDGVKEGTVYDLVNGKTEDASVVFVDEANDEVRSDVFVYGDRKSGCMTSTSGQVKKKEITFPCNNLPGFDYPEILNVLSCGMMEQLMLHPRDAKGKAKPVAQLSTRESQVKAPAVEGIDIDVVAVYMGIISPLWDGEIYVQDEYMADWYVDRLGSDIYEVLPSAVRGTTAQCRPYMTKGNGVVVSRAYLHHFVLGRKREMVIILRDDIKNDKERLAHIQEEYNKSIWSKGKEGEFAGKIVIIADNKAQLREKGIQVFTDLNGKKETHNVLWKSGLNALDTTAEHDEVKTSVQTFSTFLVANKEKAHDLFISRTEREVERVWQSVTADEGVAPHADEIGEFTNYTQLGASVFPMFYRKHWRPGYRSIVNGAVKGLSGKVANLNLANEGSYDVIVTDAGLDFGINLLKFENGIAEVFCKDLKGKDGMTVRFPKANAFAISIVRPVFLEEMMDRARTAGLGLKELYLMKERLESQSEGVMMVPASQAIMDKHDGWDYDGDHVQTTTDEYTVEMVKPMTTIIDHICDDETYKEAYDRHCSKKEKIEGNEEVADDNPLALEATE